jgi:hypothetical protein
MFKDLLPKLDKMANIPKELVVENMTRARPVMHIFIGHFVDEADTNGDGKLSMAESRAYKKDVAEMQQHMRKLMAKAKAEEARNKPMKEF